MAHSNTASVVEGTLMLRKLLSRWYLQALVTNSLLGLFLFPPDIALDMSYRVNTSWYLFSMNSLAMLSHQFRPCPTVVKLPLGGYGGGVKKRVNQWLRHFIDLPGGGVIVVKIS